MTGEFKEQPLYNKKIINNYDLKQKKYSKLTEFYFMALSSAHYHFVPILKTYE